MKLMYIELVKGVSNDRNISQLIISEMHDSHAIESNVDQVSGISGTLPLFDMPRIYLESRY